MKTKDAPILYKEWKNKVRRKRAKKSKRSLTLVLGMYKPPRARAWSKPRLRRRSGRYEVVTSTSLIGQHTFPPNVRSIALTKRKARNISNRSEGKYVSHLELRPLPKKLPKSLERPHFIWQGKRKRGNVGEPTSVFAPDTRYTFSDTSFPWSTCGRIDTAAGWGSGVMIGPRHVMTASHVVNWASGSTAGWLKFTPLYFDGSAPFGSAYATRIYYWLQADASDLIQASECAFDYVVCVLDSRLGNTTGWMGSRGYSTSWNGGAYWAHVGYPADMAGGQRPAYHGPGVMDSTFTQNVSGRSSYGIRHRNDIWPGQSGGPFFGWWAGEAWPRVVSSQSAENWGGTGGPNTCGGGDPLPYLINYARTQSP
ncbi:MAG: trypsin-like peptidase domain-containing protein [Desulfobacterales bacterium]